MSDSDTVKEMVSKGELYFIQSVSSKGEPQGEPLLYVQRHAASALETMGVRATMGAYDYAVDHDSLREKLGEQLESTLEGIQVREETSLGHFKNRTKDAAKYAVRTFFRPFG